MRFNAFFKCKLQMRAFDKLGCDVRTKSKKMLCPTKDLQNTQLIIGLETSLKFFISFILNL